MENNNVKTRDLSPFASIAVIATLFVLSGCNVAPPSIDTPPEAPVPAAAMEKLDKDGEAMMEDDSHSDGAAMEADGAAMESDEVTLVEPVVAAVASYESGAMQAFDQETFDTAMADGKKVLLDFYADWCTVCRGNAPVIESAVEADGEVVGFKVDYDTAQALRSKYGVVSQSTYITLKNDQELGRTLGAQSADTMSTLLSK